MKKQIIATIALLMTTALSVNAYYDNNDYRPHTLPGRTVDTAVGGAADVTVGAAEGAVDITGDTAKGVFGGFFGGKERREERRQDRKDRRQQREQERKDRAARHNQ